MNKASAEFQENGSKRARLFLLLMTSWNSSEGVNVDLKGTVAAATHVELQYLLVGGL